MSTPVSTPAAVAVVGMSCRLPGGVDSPAAFWDALMAGRDLVTDHTPDHPRASILPAGILTPRDWELDNAHFRLPGVEVAAMDVQQKLLLELVDEAFQDAHLTLAAHQGTRVGMWVGCSGIDHALTRLGPGQGGTMIDTAGALPSMLANRVSRHRRMDWRGPSEVIDTACSASLVAVHRARQALLAGEVDVAVVAGVNHLGLDTHTRMFAASGVLSSTGRVRPFDRAGDGFVRGEGGAAVVLQRADDAARTRAVLAGSLTNSDGAAKPIGTPNEHGQRDLLMDTYLRAGVPVYQVDYVEAHGTGTGAGDRAEARALGAVLGREDAPRPWVGSVKANVGHLEGAAGIVSLVKAVLAVEQGVIPPTPHHDEPLPVLDKRGLRVPTRPVPWPRRFQTRTAGVSAFGYGGTNAHVIVQSAPEVRLRPRPVPEGAQVIAVSASTPAALAATARAWAGAVPGADLAAVSAASLHDRDHRATRAAVVADDADHAAEALQALADGFTHLAAAGPRTPHRRPRVVFVYPGHGAHPTDPDGDHGLGGEAEFITALDEARRALSPYLGGAGGAGLDRCQPAQWAWQVAMTRTLRAYGITPDVVVGHSLGEVAAAHTAGALSLDDAARLVAARSRLLAGAAHRGCLLATSLTLDQAHAALVDHPDVVVAAHNSMHSTVLSGARADLDHLAAELHGRQVWTRHITDAPPAHSPLVAAEADELPVLLDGLTAHPVQVPMLSTVTARPAIGTDLGPAYWGTQLGATVTLHPVIRHLAADEHPLVVVEIGARPVLGSALAATLSTARRSYEVDPPLVSVSAHGDARTDLRMALAHAYTHGLDPRWPRPATVAAALPLTAWDHPAPAPEDAPGTARGLVGVADHLRHLITALTPGTIPPQNSHTLAELGVESLSLAHLRHQLLRQFPDLDVPPVEALARSRTIADLLATVTGTPSVPVTR